MIDLNPDQRIELVIISPNEEFEDIKRRKVDHRQFLIHLKGHGELSRKK